MDYKELLKDPRWQRKRLEIMQRDNFRCRVCGNDANQLQIHHIMYHNDYKTPWEYPDQLLITLCKDCHDYESNFNQFNIANAILKDLVELSNEPLSKFGEIIHNHYKLMNEEEYSYNEALKMCYLKFMQQL